MGFAKGESKFRGVSRNSDFKKWQARLGKSAGLKSLYLGSFDTEEEAARAYDIAYIRLEGRKAMTNYDLNQYNIQRILQCRMIPIGKGASKLIRTCTVEEILSDGGKSEKLERKDLEDTIPGDGDQSSNDRPFNDDPELGFSSLGNSSPEECSKTSVRDQINRYDPDSSLFQSHQNPNFHPGYGGQDPDKPFFTHGFYNPDIPTKPVDEVGFSGNPNTYLDFQENSHLFDGFSSTKVTGNGFSKNSNNTCNEDSSTGAEIDFQQMGNENLPDKRKSIVRNSPFKRSKTEGPADSDDEMKMPPGWLDMNSIHSSSSNSDQ
ncbi:AP2-like ethylene-responsive transcription factor PLT1 [Carica papaya]|uniref:AP2-like ethylene-responsive transcription factor PLT1 n=1 Tax=Carica papaya TaxID=3649 RepID=UPI000B8CD1AC|nr:AP2-like ethylene-responsive transcription factor PLT1 [Carica papaya]